MPLYKAQLRPHLDIWTPIFRKAGTDAEKGYWNNQGNEESILWLSLKKLGLFSLTKHMLIEDVIVVQKQIRGTNTQDGTI